MRSSAHTAPSIRFSAISLGVVSLIAAAYCLIGWRVISGRERGDAAEAVARDAGAAYVSIFDQVDADAPLPDSARRSADTLTFSLGGGAIRGVRVTSTSGATVYEGGARFEPLTQSADTGQALARRSTGADGAALFVAQIGGGGYVIDIAEDPGPIDEAVAHEHVVLIGTTVIVSLAAWVGMSAAYWLGSRVLRGEHGRLLNLYDTGQQLRSSLDLHDVLSQLARDATRLAGARYGLVALYDEPASEVVLRATYDSSTGSVSLHQRAIDDWNIRRCVVSNSPHVATMADSIVRQYFGHESDRDLPLLCAPMALRDHVVGAIAVAGMAHGHAAFGQDQLALLTQLAGQAVTAVEQSLLFAKVRSSANEVEASYDATLKALMAALESKDDLTEGHCERVAKLTLQLAKMLDIPEAQLVHIERGAMLHDVGKIGVPDDILKKPASLNESEWEAMRKHPLLAGLMVSKVGFLEPAMPILLYHHEKFDGTGYPFGLAGSNIPLEARIFSIVDAYDAMTQDRPYRDAMPHADAMAEIRQHTGTQFDPKVVEAFEQLMFERPDLRCDAAPTRRVLTMDDIHRDPPPQEDAEPAA